MKPKRILFKYGGNAMTDDLLKDQILRAICGLTKEGHQVVILHGGGPFIAKALAQAGIESQFVDGHRKTTPEAMIHVEMALKGQVNGDLVRRINALGHTAVGLSGKDGQTVIATKRFHQRKDQNGSAKVDLGQVGDVAQVNTQLLDLLLTNGYIPVVTCVASDAEGHDFNINADAVAGHIAAALDVDDYIVLTDVDGLLKDKDDPSSLIAEVKASDAPQLLAAGIIQGGMIPKFDSCIYAVTHGAKSARILNGTVPAQIEALAADRHIGTTFRPNTPQ